MVAVRDTHMQKEFELAQWLASLTLDESERSVLATLYRDCENLGGVEQTLLIGRGVEMVEILMTLSMDLDTLQAAVLTPFYQQELINDEQLETRYGVDIRRLVQGVREMNAISSLEQFDEGEGNPLHVDNIRRMLLAMVEDVRAVVIKLAERITCLREVKNAEEEERVLVAKGIANIYAPLANRLGIGQLKWELEDLAFRYLHPDIYKRIAKQLDERRIDREHYIETFVSGLQQKIEDAGIKAQVYGRPKHIYSIWRKMQKKDLDFSELYDVRAVRIIADQLQDCYGALGIVHTQWRHIPREFDDYVANPKPNGYQSIHTVVLGPEGKSVEIQIRTEQMHQNAELGVAAHWKYKEGPQAGKRSGYEEKIAWLRKLLAWQEDMAENDNLVDELRAQVFDDRVYVFTPRGEVVDLSSGATPLDFAYYVHSMVGHRCIGAKVHGRIVPFTYKLQMGDQVEIITQKEPNPSRDWLNPNLGFICTNRARAKVVNWFRKQDRDKNIAAGKDLLEGELSRNGLHMSQVDDATLKRFHVINLEDLWAGVGSGDLRINQLLNFLQAKHNQPSVEQQEEELLERLKQKAVPNERSKPRDHIVVDGIGNLMTHLARCCQPIPGDGIEGYITQGRGISIHRSDCDQFKELARRHPERTIHAVWNEHYSSGYALKILVSAHDRSGLLRDITTILANDKINVLGMQTRSELKHQRAEILLEIELYNIDALGRVLTRISQLQDVIDAKRM